MKHERKTRARWPESGCRNKSGLADRLKAQVTHVEKLGGDTNVIADTGGQQVTARLFGQHDIKPGADITLGYAPEKAYYFDATGARLR